MAPGRVNTRTFLAACGAVAVVQFGLGRVPVTGFGAWYAVLGTARVIQAGLILGLAAWLGQGLSDIGLSRGAYLKGLVRGMVWTAGFGALAGAGMLVMYLAGTNPFLMLRGGAPRASGWPLALFLGVGVLVGPVAEEVFFRGLVFGFFRRWGALAAIGLSTAPFVWCHGAGGRFPLTQLVGGLVFALCYEREKNLMAPMVVHVAGNGALFAVSLFYSG